LLAPSAFIFGLSPLLGVRFARCEASPNGLFFDALGDAVAFFDGVFFVGVEETLPKASRDAREETWDIKWSPFAELSNAL
jgi:hypothetical protein